MKKIISILLTICLLSAELTLFSAAKTKQPSEVFEDISLSDWSYSNIMRAYEYGYIKGTTEYQFSPKTQVSRAMAVSLLKNLSLNKSEYSSRHTFKDVVKTDWYHSSVEWAYANKISAGIYDTIFAPNSNVLRQDFICLIYRYAKKFAHSPRIESSNKSIEDFKDSGKVSDYAREAMNWALQYSIISGYADYINPRDLLTREQAVTILITFDNAMGHTLKQYETFSPRTCESNGCITYRCSICKKETTVSTKAHHLWQAPVKVEPTCTVNGKIETSCKSCHTKKTEIIPATGVHTYSDWIEETPITKTSSGFIYRYCKKCKTKQRKFVRYDDYYQVQYKITLPSADYNVNTNNVGLKVLKINQALLGTTNSVFTAQTENAVRKFQSTHKLKVCGQVNLATWLALGYKESDWKNLSRYVTPMKVTQKSSKSDYTNAMIKTAKEYASAKTKYRIGCSGKPGTYIDDGGLIYQCLYSAGISPDSSVIDHSLAKYENAAKLLASDKKLGYAVNKSRIKAGDIIFYAENGSGTISHAAVSAGKNMIYDSAEGIGTTYRAQKIKGMYIVKVIRVFP